MGFQSTINNLLTSAAVAGRALKYSAKESEMKKAGEIAAAQEAENQKLAAQEAEKASIEGANSKIDEAIKLSVGYSNEDITKQNAAKDLGIEIPEKNPRGVSQKTFDRRMANAKAMEEIVRKYAQDKDWRDRLEKYTAKDLSRVLNPSIRSKKGGVNNGK